MPTPKLSFFLQNLHHGWWVAVLSDGVQEATITASSIPSEPLLPLLWAVRLLLLGASEAKCSWWEEPGEYRWLFSRQAEQILIHIVWFDSIADWSDEKGKTVLQMESDLLTFAKRLSINWANSSIKRGVLPFLPRIIRSCKRLLRHLSTRNLESIHMVVRCCLNC